MVVKMRKEVKPVVVIEQDGKDFTVTVKTNLRTHVNTFTIGKESEVTTMDGRKFKVYYILIISLRQIIDVFLKKIKNKKKPL